MPKITLNSNIKLLNRTHFKKSRTEDEGWQWFWSKESPNGNVISVGGQGYHNLGDCINGYFSQEGHPEWTPKKVGASYQMPSGYHLDRFDAQHYTITKYTEDTEEIGEDQ